MKDINKFIGCLLGGAIGDALGYPISFLNEDDNIQEFGKKIVTEYKLIDDRAIISDVTQMTLFTANAILVGKSRIATRGIGVPMRVYCLMGYYDWLRTQEMTFEDAQKIHKGYKGDNSDYCITWLSNIPAIYNTRFIRETCISAIKTRKKEENGSIEFNKVFIDKPINNCKRVEGITRITPMSLAFDPKNIEDIDKEAAEIAAITHGHPLSHMTAAFLTHVMNRIIYKYDEYQTFEEIVLEARNPISCLFSSYNYIEEFIDKVNLAISLSKNNYSDLKNILKFKEPWNADEALAISLYCVLQYYDDFDKAITTAINNNGDSASIGAMTGSIVGAIVGENKISNKWKEKLELKEIIIELADDLYSQAFNYGESAITNIWDKKYWYMEY